MTFTQIKTKVLNYCGLTSTDADTRVGLAINAVYRRVTSSLGLDAARFVTRSVSMSIGVQTVTFTEIEKIDRIIDATDSTAIRLLQEVSVHEIRSTQPGTDEPTRWALQNTDADSVVAIFNTLPQSAYSLQADGWTTLSDLSGSDEPVFPESFHDILAWEVVAEELLKKEKDKLADKYTAKADKLLSELRFHLADSPTRDTRQGESRVGSTAGASGGGGSVGGTAYTQTALITFDRDPSAPFAVTDTSAYVPHLFAEGVGNVTTDRLIGRDTAATGESEQLTVGGGVEFTGSGGIQTSAFTGDVTKAAGGTVTTIAANAVVDTMLRDSAAVSVIGRSANSSGDPADIVAASNGQVLKRTSNALSFAAVDLAADVTGDLPYANLVQASAASRVLVRGSAGGAGDWQEGSLGSGLSMSGTTLSAVASVQTLLYANSGTDTNAGTGVVVDSIAISGLTAKDTLLIFYDVESVTQQTASFSPRNTTDDVELIDQRTITAGSGHASIVRIRQSQAGATKVNAVAFQCTIPASGANGAAATDGQQSTFVQNWTGSWTLGLQHEGVTAGGTFRYAWSVYKVAGQ